MNTSFPFVDAGEAAGTGSVSVNVNEGDIIIAVWAGTGCQNGYPVPTSVSFSLGESLGLFSQSMGAAADVNTLTQMWLGVATGTGVCEVTFNGWSVEDTSGPSVIAVSYSLPPGYQILGWGIDGGNPPAVARALACNGIPGGDYCSDTGDDTTGSASLPGVVVTMTPVGSIIEFTSNHLAGVLLLNQFRDVLLIVANYCNSGYPIAPFFDVTGGTLRATTQEFSDSTCTASLGLSDGPFPYLSGPLTVMPPPQTGGTVGTPYESSVTVSGGTPPYDVSQWDGSLPTGLTLNPDGSITGIPTTPGAYNKIFEAMDSETPANRGFSPVVQFQISGPLFTC